MQANVKSRVFTILELAATGDVTSRLCDLIIVNLIVLNTIAVIVETVPTIPLSVRAALQAFELFSVFVFTLEYGLRLWACTSDPRFSHPLRGRLRFVLTPLALIDGLVLLPFYLPYVMNLNVESLLALRLLRLFRIFKIGRYSASMRLFGVVLREKKEELYLAVAAVVVLLVFASSLMYFLERRAQAEAFSSIPAAMWWGIATLTTVGYGDIYPITPLGKTMGAIIALLGIGLFALPAGVLASGFAEALGRRDRARLRCPHCGRELSG